MISPSHADAAASELDMVNTIRDIGFACHDCTHCDANGCEECDHRGLIEMSADTWCELLGLTDEYCRQLADIISQHEDEWREAHAQEIG